MKTLSVMNLRAVTKALTIGQKSLLIYKDKAKN